MNRPDPGTEVVNGITHTLPDNLVTSNNTVFPEWAVTSTKTVGAYTLTLYASGRVLVTVTATGVGVPAGEALRLMYPSLA